MAKKLSIEIITKGEKELEQTLESISRQSFNEYDVVCVNSSEFESTSRLLSSFGATEIRVPANMKALEARYLAHYYSESEYALLLDATRPLRRDTLGILMENYSQYPLVCVKEGSIGEGFWVKQVEYLKATMTYDKPFFLREMNSYMLGRFFERGVLNSAFQVLKNDLPDELFREISYGEHQLITEAAFRFTKTMVLTKETLIDHFEDENIKQIFRKYHWYGKSQRILSKMEQEYRAKDLGSHFKKLGFKALSLRIKSLPISLTRAVPFMVGLYIW